MHYQILVLLKVIISENIVNSLNLKIYSSSKQITIVQRHFNQSHGFVIANLKLSFNKLYSVIHLHVLKDLHYNVVLRTEFQHQHCKVIFEYCNHLPELVKNTKTCCALEVADIGEFTLFLNITFQCKSIVTKSKHFSRDDQDFIDMKINKILVNGIIDPCILPWCAQVVAVKYETKRHRKRLCTDQHLN